MGARGRKSAAALAVVPGLVTTLERPMPPAELTDEQVCEWKDLTSAEPADKFPRPKWGALVQFCRSRVAARRVAQLIEAEEESGEGLDLDRYDKLLKMQERESRILASLGVRLELLSSTGNGKGTSGDVNRPWDTTN